MWMTAFSITTAKVWIKPSDLKVLNYALRLLWIKVNDNNNNVKYEKKIYASGCTEIQKNQNEVCNPAKTLISI